ncbi:MAG: acyl-CoA dehydrogenase family protein [Fluviicoccus sp.]|uniref:acyl-CoA dehydrogenase family protein n=1 Tax=Fluviicoccus sp. TaxID=2003552 RepID=UPI00271BF481|nr:acyl-CoA dehydrogenase family protein [Fluviicoccus sp.]MDO8332113.1 acyl-CoA dehydrogenase family protein [Fluviicoccus sp.]
MNTAKKRWMDSDLELYRDNVRRFVQTEIAAHGEKWAKQQHVDREVWRKAGELGLLLADVPDDFGGSGGNYAHMAVLFEELAYAGDRAFGAHVHAIAAHYILNLGTEEQKAKYLPLLASGEMIGAIAMSEPNAGSDLQGTRTRAVRDGDEYVINGSKIFISNGYLADLIVVVTKTDPDAGAKGVSLMLLETKNAPGFKVGRILEKLGQKGQDTCELFFDDVRVPVANLLGGVEGKGFYHLMSELPYERLMLGIGAMAIIERALDLTVTYTKERKAFGKPLFEMQNTRFVLANLQSQAVMARAFVDDCIQRMIDGELDTVTASMVKLNLSELECKVMDDCLQFFGGYGYMLEYPITQMYADARVQRIYGGTSEIMKEIIARSM